MATKTETREGLPDLRLPIGIFFIVASLIVLAAAFTSHPAADIAPVAVNADRNCGIVLLIFGILMAYFGWRAGPEIIETHDLDLDINSADGDVDTRRSRASDGGTWPQPPTG